MNNVMIVNRALIVEKSKCLMVKRSPQDEYFPGKWELPGGKLENGHTFEENLKKEIKEELGIEIDIVKTNIVIHEDQVKEGRHKGKIIVEIVDLAKPTTNNIELSEDHSDYGWFSESDIKTLNTTQYSQKVIDKLPDDYNW